MDEGRAVALVRPAALSLPAVVEEPAWLGVRWRVRGRTFAHVLVVRDGRPPSYAQALGGVPHCVVAFRSGGPELDALAHAGPPFHAVPGRDGVVLLDLDRPVDREELHELLTESWLVLAPASLRSRLVTP